MPAILPVYRPDAKRDLERTTRRREHAAAFEVATCRITGHVARALGKPGQRLLEEISHGDKRGPFEVCEEQIEVSRRHKSELDAIAPLATLCRRVGYDLTPTVTATGEAGIVSACGDALRDAGRAVADTIAAITDGHLTAAEARKVLPELDQAIADLHRLRASVAASNVLSMPAGGAR